MASNRKSVLSFLIVIFADKILSFLNKLVLAIFLHKEEFVLTNFNEEILKHQHILILYVVVIFGLKFNTEIES